jgi:hypothetical protein
MRAAFALLALGLLAAAPAAGQTGAPTPEPPANPYRDLFTRWDGANRDSLAAEANTAQPAPAPDGDTSIPAYSPLVSRSRDEAVALGERVGAVVRTGNCAEGERIARAAGDFPLVRAVREHCRRPR